MSAGKPTQAGFWIVTFVIVLLFSALVLSRGRSKASPTPPVFENSSTLADARRAASAADKPVLVFATADWCGPCQSFKGSTLRDPAVADAFKAGTIPVYLDVDQRSDDAATLNIRSIPVLILIRDGREVSRLEGNRDAPTVLKWLDASVSAPTPAG